MAVWIAVLITYGVSTGIAMMASNTPPELVLDLAEKSVDDMYSHCRDQMQTKVQTEYLPNEKNTDINFKGVWDQAEAKYDRKFRNTRPRIGKERAVALYVYTGGANNFHENINNAVREQGSDYKNFKYHALHFFLTTAIQELNTGKPENERCRTAYRGVDRAFNRNVLNKEFRFGSFTSSSLFKKVAKKFGVRSCFEIYTCLGADISNYSRFGEGEGEVLIPPYEVFKVTEIRENYEDEDEDEDEDDENFKCDVFYKVTSTRQLSKFDCHLFKNQAVSVN